MFGSTRRVYSKYWRWLGGRCPRLPSASPQLRTSIPGLVISLVRTSGSPPSWRFFAYDFFGRLSDPLGVLAARPTAKGFSTTSQRILAWSDISFPTFGLATLRLPRHLADFFVGSPRHNGRPGAAPWVNLASDFMPALSLSLALMAVTMRMTRSSMLEVLNQD